MVKLSAVIITFNEERNIGRCLESLKGIVDDVIVVDSFSKDKTEEICLKFGARFIQTEWKGYSETKNYANSLANFDWILSLDADEALSEELKKSILKAKEKGLSGCYEFNRLTNYCGIWVKYGGWYPDTKTRLFNRNEAKWTGLIHENLEHDSSLKTSLLAGDCLHYSYYTVEEHWNQTVKFSTMAAEMLYKQGKKATFVKRFLSPTNKFIRDYFFKLGFLNGKKGFIICKISAYATYIKYENLRKLIKFVKD